MSPTESRDVTAIVLAGGRSRRMGRDKAALVLGGRTLLQRAVDAAGSAADAIIVVGAPGRLLPAVTSSVPLVLLADAEEGSGPLAGTVTGLRAVRTAVAVVLACDMPFVTPSLLSLLASVVREGVSAAVPVVEGEPQPLCSAVRADALGALEAMLAGGARAASVLLDLPRARPVGPDEWRRADPDGQSFVGVNTPEEWEQARALDARLRGA